MPPSGDSISNLLSKDIITADGLPGHKFKDAAQFQAIPPFQTKFFVSLDKHEKAPYEILPEPTLNYAPVKTIFPPGTPLAFAPPIEPSLDMDDLNLLTTGAATEATQTFVQTRPAVARLTTTAAAIPWPFTTFRWATFRS